MGVYGCYLHGCFLLLKCALFFQRYHPSSENGDCQDGFLKNLPAYVFKHSVAWNEANLSIALSISWMESFLKVPQQINRSRACNLIPVRCQGRPAIFLLCYFSVIIQLRHYIWSFNALHSQTQLYSCKKGWQSCYRGKTQRAPDWYAPQYEDWAHTFYQDCRNIWI